MLVFDPSLRFIPRPLDGDSNQARAPIAVWLTRIVAQAPLPPFLERF